MAEEYRPGEDYDYDAERERRRRRRKRQRMLARKRARRRRRIAAAAVSCAAIVCIILTVGKGAPRRSGSEASAQAGTESTESENTAAAVSSAAVTAETSEETGSPFFRTDATAELSDVKSTIGTVDSSGDFRDDAVTTDEAKESSIASSKEAGFTGADNDYVASPFMILVNADTDEVVAERAGQVQMYPASMTKVMTILVAAEHLNQGGSLNDTVEITQAICDESWLTGSSYVGYAAGDTATVQDLLYGAAMASGADAALGLAYWAAGSEEAFAELMNQKAQELGISQTTHFTNCIGTFSVDHYTTAQDMAVIMKAAMSNDVCREVLSAHTYHAQAVASTPDGFDLSNWFLRRIEDRQTHGTVLCAKTGYVQQAGNCAVSYAQGDDGAHYILVTGKVWDGWRCIYDQAAVYCRYIPSDSAETGATDLQEGIDIQ